MNKQPWIRADEKFLNWDSDKFSAVAYDPYYSYAKGDLVMGSDGNQYICEVDNTLGQSPVINVGYKYENCH